MKPEPKIDLKSLDSLTDEDIREAILKNPDAAPEMDDATVAKLQPAEQVLPGVVAAHRARRGPQKKPTKAKNKLSEVIDDALTEGPQLITRRGEEVVIVLAYPEYQRLTGTDESLYEFFRRSPLVGMELDPSRDEDEIPDRFAP